MYRLKDSDAVKGGQVLARAFENDPIWASHMKDPVRRVKILPLMFEFLILLGNRFGEVWSPGEKIEGVYVALDRKYADIGFFGLLFSGLIFKTGKMLRHYSKDMKSVQKEMKILSKERRRIMKGRDYIYLTCIGVDPRLQGKGEGGRMLKHLFESAEERKIPIYLETETENNEKMYSYYGFKLVKEKGFSGSGLHIWQMVRDV